MTEENMTPFVKSLLAILRVILILIGVAGLAVGLLKTAGIDVLTKSPPTAKEYARRLTAKDRANLGNAKAPEPDQYGALVRLAEQLDPAARAQALRETRSSSRVMRAGAALALGYFDDPEALGALEALLKDREQEVREAALSGLANRPGKEREKKLQSFLQQAASEKERALTRLTLIRLKQDPQSRENSIRDALESIQKVTLKTAPDADALWRTLLTVAGQNPKVLAAARQLLASNRIPGLNPLLIRHLSAIESQESAWLRASLVKLAATPDAPVRSAIIDAIPLSCPKDRWSILQLIAQDETNPVVLVKVVTMARLLRGKEAPPLLRKLQARKGLADIVGKEAGSALDSLGHDAVVPIPCLNGEKGA